MGCSLEPPLARVGSWTGRSDTEAVGEGLDLGTLGLGHAELHSSERNTSRPVEIY